MIKKSLREDQKMSVAAAREMATGLVQRESRGPGDLDNAMRRVEAKYGVPYSVLWSLRYRQPKDILLGVFTKIRAAYQAECARQAALLEHELTITRAVSDEIDPKLVEQVEALVREIRESQSTG
ncbi:hypothetical protein [uncultured Roseibium sp.]|uniref:hypothetical protein n=1 Tax=uncultured Roseibium sp. TaxID=1936171 RepID=UPI002610CC20|nr:hypothetical protein [uncultured Roseibium sp.]